ncbi:MAG: DUF2905 domain-containing protein [Gemmatimonadetes bacterium]|nr:DUF2905 domain-containing protein [Gemmatimonadota bacterium]
MGKEFGTLLIAGGIFLVLLGLLASSGALSWFGKLPGDFRSEGENVRFYFPLASMIVLSVVFTIVVNVIRRLF